MHEDSGYLGHPALLTVPLTYLRAQMKIISVIMHPPVVDQLWYSVKSQLD